jgi:hypothetical protein
MSDERTMNEVSETSTDRTVERIWDRGTTHGAQNGANR